jgi:hypothetical protein
MYRKGRNLQGVFESPEEIVSGHITRRPQRRVHTPVLTQGPSRPRFLNFLVRLMMVALVLDPSTGSGVDICMHFVVSQEPKCGGADVPYGRDMSGKRCNCRG